MGFASLRSAAQNHLWCLPSTLQCLPPVPSACNTCCCQPPLPLLPICPLPYATLSILLGFHRHLEAHLFTCSSKPRANRLKKQTVMEILAQGGFFSSSMVISSWCYVYATSPVPPSGSSDSGCSLESGCMWHPSFERLGTARVLGVPQQKAVELISYCLG